MAAKPAEEHRGHIEAVLSAAVSDPALVAHARAYLSGADDPAGAAAIASIVDRAQNGNETPRTFTDGWIASRGLAFAACALAELSGIASSAEGLRPLDSLRQVDPVSLRRVRLVAHTRSAPVFSASSTRHERLSRGHRPRSGRRCSLSATGLP
ncbi:hypothetical protein [Nonomuraea sp. NPDC049480]|uniref:hypothetical protein n=1 Tax=Nonomuraea sp. NPDC049480 TaxID=3364353 RepID=UPI0037BAB982